MYIRKAKIEDIPKIIDLLYQIHDIHAKDRPDIFKKGEKKYTEEEIKQILKNNKRPILVAVDESDIVVGYVFCALIEQRGVMLIPIKTLYIDDFCVDKKVRGKKVGKILYEEVLKLAKNEGCYNVTLNVWATNKEAINFYEKCGLTVQKIGMEQIL